MKRLGREEEWIGCGLSLSHCLEVNIPYKTEQGEKKKTELGSIDLPNARLELITSGKISLGG